MEKKGSLTFQSGGLPIPPSQKPKEEHFTYDGLIDKLKDKLVVIQGNIITCGDDYFYEKCDPTFQKIKMKKLVVNKYKKTSTTKPYYYIAEDFKSNLYIGNDVNILNTTTAKLKFDYIFSIKDVNLVNLDLNNIYYNDYNLIIFKNGSYYEYKR